MSRLSAVVLLCVAVLVAVLALAQSMPQMAAPQMAGNHQQVVGANRCTWGPGYWCSSHAAANECSTLDWCVEKQMLTRPTVA